MLNQNSEDLVMGFFALSFLTANRFSSSDGRFPQAVKQH